MLQTIIFDFGNVLGFFDHQRTLAQLAPFTDLSADEIYHRLYLEELEHQFEAGQLSEEEFLQQVRQRCGLRCEDAFLRQAIADIFWPNPETCTLVPRLKDRYRLLLGSNTNPLHARHFQREFADTLAHFDELVLSHEIRCRKPHAAFFEHCLQLAGCPAGQCLFIDDMPANVASARSCGLQALAYAPDCDLPGQLRALGVGI